MRIVALILAGALLGACTEAAAHPQPPSVARGTSPAAIILVSEGGVMRPIENGGRVALRTGWATLRFSPVPLDFRSTLDMTLFDASGAPAAGEVSAQYESIDMDHGRTTSTSAPHEGGYRMPLVFEMPGSWKVVVRIVRAGAEETITIVLPAVGM